jgi:TolB-like protein/tRNA A-37 threonylcarbamoyl transferase component Bud32/tetratricopeptide (TPR) repeat protein
VNAVAQLTAALAGRYEILREAGAGGMATVYVARDLKHERQVAIKVLKPDLAATLGPERFLQEVRIAAQLQHPHILPVFDSGDANGTLWYAMPFVDGESLRDRLRTGAPMSIGEVTRILREVASALAKAHDAGIVHRDIKPENILLSGGHALVADFGIAKAVTSAASSSSGLTSAGMSLGTPGYMAPEQVAADPKADHRVDLYSLGIVAWELVVGKAPFADLPPAQQLAAHVTTNPDPVRAKRQDCPPALEAVIQKCLAKAPEQRFQKAAELVDSLDRVSDPSGAHPPLVGARPPGVARILGLSTGVIFVAAAVLYGLFGGPSTPATATGPSLAVLPFENMQGDSATAYFSDGITEEIIGAVSRVPGLHVASRSVSFRHRGKDIDVQQVGRLIGVSHLLEGSVQRAGNRVRVNVRLTDARSGFNTWSERYDRELTDIFAVEDEIATKVAGALDVQLGARAVPSAGGTKNVQAHDAYLLGLKARNERSLRASADHFARAIALDPNYAAAHATLASVLVLFPEYGLVPRPDSALRAARSAAERALSLDSSQATAHLALGYAAKVYSRDFGGAEMAYRRALDLDPNSAEGHHWFGELLMERGRFEDARAEFRASVARDSLAPASVAMLAMSMFRIAKAGGDAALVDSAQSICRHVMDISPPGGVFPFEFGCGTALTGAKRFDAARVHLARAGRAIGDSTMFVTMVDGVANPSRRASAIGLVDRLAGARRLDAALAAFWYMHLGESGKALAALERAEAEHSPYGAFLEVLDFSAMPQDARLAAVRKKLGY